MTGEISRSDSALLEPIQSGSLGSQHAPPLSGDVHGPAPTAAYGNVGAMLTSHADSKSVAVGQIAVAAYTDAVNREQSLRTQLESAREQFDAARRDSATKDTTIAVLQERDQQRTASAWMEKLSLTVGGALCGAAVALAIEPTPNLGILMGLLAVAGVLLIVGLRINSSGRRT
jgi:hypothetical protein